MLNELQRISSNCVDIKTDGGLFRVEAYDRDIVRVRYTLEEQFSVKKSLMVTEAAKDVQLNSEETEDAILLTTDEVSLEVGKDGFGFDWKDSRENILLREPAGGKELKRKKVYRAVKKTSTESESVETGDGVKSYATDLDHEYVRDGYGTKLCFEFSEGEAIYGLGQHEEGYFNYRGKYQDLYQQNKKVAMPVMVSSRGWGILVDSYSFCEFEDDEKGARFETDVDDELDYYFIYGPEFDEIMRGIRYLTGKAEMLPRWAYGYMQSKERYESQKELIKIVEEYRRRKIPLDVIIQDWKTWPEGMWGEKQFDGGRYPDPEGLVGKLHEMDTKIMVSIWPNMKGGPNTEEMGDKGFLLNDGMVYNAFDPEARDVYWKQAYEGYYRYGIDGWWCDCTEPFSADHKGKFTDVKPEREVQTKINVEEAKRNLDPGYINAYSLVHSKGIYENQKKVSPEKRMVNLTRSGYPGQHRYGTITWSGDICARWDVLRSQIAEGLSFCMCGSPYWTLDIGAFFTRNDSEWWFRNGDYEKGCEDLGYRELYVRWFQYGAFLPIFRSHGTDTPREVWRFGEEGEMFYDALVKFDELRYRLMPYIYSVAGQVYHEDYTMMRSLVFDFAGDKKVLNIKDQYMFGPALMVCPVTEAMYYGPGSEKLEGVSKSREVYLPEGFGWYDFWTGEYFEGGQTITADATLDKMPIYVRAGSILPMGPVVQYADEKPDSDWEVRVYGGTDGSFSIYEDEGEGFGYKEGEFAWTDMKWFDEEGRLEINDREGDSGNERSFDIFLVTGNVMELNRSEKPDAIIDYKGRKICRILK